MRTFLALEIPDGFRKEVSEVLSKSRQICPREVKWVEPKNLHFTLQFIGDINKSAFERLNKGLAEIFGKMSAFMVYSATVELFPAAFKQQASPRLFWVRCSYDEKVLQEVSHRIRSLMKGLLIDFDNKPLKLHITLGRIKKQLTTQQIEKLSSLELPESGWLIKTATLYESRLHSYGPEYFVLERYELPQDSDN